MRKWMLTCAVVSVACIVNESTQAQEQIRTANTVVTSNQVAAPAQRTGLLGRFRNRGQVMVSQPATTTATTAQTPAVVQPTTPATTTTTQMQVVETRRGLLGRIRPTRQVVTVEPPVSSTSKSTPAPTVQQTQATTTPMTTTTNTVPVNEGRQGILSRLRGRLGR